MASVPSLAPSRAMNVRMPRALYAEIERRAALEQRSLSQIVVRLLEATMADAPGVFGRPLPPPVERS